MEGLNQSQRHLPPSHGRHPRIINLFNSYSILNFQPQHLFSSPTSNTTQRGQNRSEFARFAWIGKYFFYLPLFAAFSSRRLFLSLAHAPRLLPRIFNDRQPVLWEAIPCLLTLPRLKASTSGCSSLCQQRGYPGKFLSNSTLLN